MFARFDENPAMTLRVIKETKRYGRTHRRTDARTDGQRENSIPLTNKVCGGYKNSMVSKKRIPYLFEGGIVKSVLCAKKWDSKIPSSRTKFVITRQASANSDPQCRFFYYNPHS